jgi:hypothetical protein
MTASGSGARAFVHIGSIVPVRDGWLVATAKLRGGAFSPDPPKVVPDLARAIEGRPRFTMAGINVPIGDALAAADGRRQCDVEAVEKFGLDPNASRHTNTLAGPRDFLDERYREVVATIAIRHQRSLCEFLPELSFMEANLAKPLSSPPSSEAGIEERALLLGRMPGIDRILSAELDGVGPDELQEVAAGLWTTRRVIARMGRRLPDTPEASADGFRMEVLR